ncbi:two-component system sporulation sensor kinase A [Cytobacillus firmus]|uniref:histidine kinase n=2 Tax=Cytobacillus TaxID=2675230 RepID=A0A366K4N7_CYTFI|nr:MULTISPECIES: ATP-binding protein [Cytobacillus]RBP96644.1 two-component system sporulation sensor kinase A [Cytobacillus firmus]TDX45629.1 two-component system sporulation sensor kinase A [Cytobacillus oceanisediminis]
MSKRTGQISLVLISVLFTSYQSIFSHEAFFTFDFFLFTSIAWFVGWQFDKSRYFAEKARASEKSHKLLLESLPVSVLIHKDFEILYANSAAVAELSASDKGALIGRSLLDFIEMDYMGRLQERYQYIKSEKQLLNNIEYKIKRFDGTTRFFEVSSLYVDFEGKEAILSIGTDISDKKEEQEKLLQKSEKLALLGQMAAGIAHEIRNPLTSIKGFVQLFKSNSQKDEYFDIVLSELDRINGIVGEFLVLAKPTADIFEKQDLTKLINEVILLSSTQSILNNVEIAVENNLRAPMIHCEKNQLKQVFLNVIKNAIEAMPGGGELNIKVLKKTSNTISIQFIDQGVGISEDRISSLGEPFYTTKEKGTGLGLMICYKIIENHSGRLIVESKVGEGTKIEIELPYEGDSLHSERDQNGNILFI